MTVRYWGAALIVLALLVQGWGQAEEPYRLRHDDVIRITVWGAPELTQEIPIARDGTIYVPLIGTLKVEGMTPAELADLLARKYEEGGYFQDPKVGITIVQFHRPRVSVLGMVNRPGVYEFKYGDRVLDALSYAGNYVLDRADLQHARLTRADGTELDLDLERLLLEGDLSLNYELQDGDVIFIPEATTNRIFVGGLVLRPGMYTWRRHMTVLDALSQAGWNRERGTLSRTFVVRRKPDGTTERIPVDVIALLNKADLSQNVELQPGDVVYVPETRTPNLDQLYRGLAILFWVDRLGWIGL